MEFSGHAQLFANNPNFNNTINNPTNTTNNVTNYHTQPGKSGGQMLDEVLQKLPSLDYLKSHEEALRRADRGSGTWFLDSKDFQNWSSGSLDTRAILALGDPGVGKTCLMSIVIQYLQQLGSSARVAYVYLHHKEAKLQSLTDIVSTVLKQVLSTYDNLPECVTSLHKQLKLGQGLQLEVMITALLNICKEKHATTYILIDALDECEPSHQGELVSFLKQLLPEAWVFATCRKAYRSIEGLFNTEHCVKPTIRASASDISSFLRKKLEGNLLLQSILDTQFQQTLISTIESKSQGVFLIAAMQMEYILSLPTKEKIKSALLEIPADLEAHFELTLQRINQQSKAHAQLAWMILMWLLHACRPLTITELCHALAIQTGSNKFHGDTLTSPAIVIQCCLGFVTLQNEGTSDSVVTFFHLTAQEFIQQRKVVGFNKTMAIACLTYLSYDLYQAGDKGPVLWLDQVRIQSLVTALYQYAAEYWGKHAGQCFDDEIKQAIVKFSQKINHLMLWGQQDYGAPNTLLEGYDSILLLHIAARFGLIQMIYWTDRFQANSKAAWSQETPLMIACRYQHIRIVDWLLSRADLSAKDKEDWTPLHLAAIYRHLEVAKLLIDKGADLSAKEKDDWTPLHLAAQDGHLEIVKLLLEKGADLSAKDNDHWTSLHKAARNGHLEVVELLI
ncbi:hypothetical protein BDN72DRAFT_799231, partial [Pluteus cervinus]